MECFDVAVVGAGPAGSTAALAARRGGADVVLLDRSDFPRDKPCGDGIAPEVFDVLAGLGVADVAAGYPAVPALRLVSPGGEVVARRLHAGTHTIPRRVFDHRLVAAAVDAGVRFRRHRVRTVAHDDDRVVLDGRFAARVVIGADGAGSVVRTALGHPTNPPGHLALAIRGYAPAPAGPPEQRIVTIPGRWPAYAWSFPIGDGRANVGYGELLTGGALTRGYLMARLGALLPDLDLAGATDWRGHHLPLSTRRPSPGRGRLVLAGDALSLINPFTGEGIFYAVVSGTLAGTAAAGAVAATGGADVAARYRRGLARRLGAHLRHTAVTARLGRWPRLVDAAVRAARDDQAVFDTLLGVGLADGRLNAATLWRIIRRL
ncbi:geranylgeranyl reductase family protein [Longispora sp. K20-0274]|uniref:geranylgeranyl reductase family protein n=1 Tax=Longispora sp. K20-0274 TaxID=3088255 RepID=UPI00399A7283